MGESNKRGLKNLSKSFAEAVSRTPKKQREGSVTDTSNPSPIGASTHIGPDTSTMATHPQYVVNAPLTICIEDKQKIVEAARDAVKDSLHYEFTNLIIAEKIGPLQTEINLLK